MNTRFKADDSRGFKIVNVFPAYIDKHFNRVKMDNKVLESYLDYIAGQVIDEDKIVTYKSLSRSLNVHVNIAKQLLCTFIKNEKYKSTFPLSATYLVAGKVVDGSLNIFIVNESDLKKAHSHLVQVTSEHVYSVQKGGKVKEIKSLCGVGKELSISDSNLVITFSDCVLKKKQVKKKSLPDEVINQKLIKEALVSESKTAEVTESKKKIETSKNEIVCCEKKSSPKGNSEKAQINVKKSTGNIANLFAKAAQKNSGKSAKTEIQSSKNEPKPNFEEKTKDELIKDNNEFESTEGLKKKKKGNKRKRIQLVSDSEESGSDEKDQCVEIELEEEDPLPTITCLEEEKEESSEFVFRNKRKKRKVVDKTVMNEDGYLETKKEVVFETDSENEIEVTKLNEEKRLKTEEAVVKRKGLNSAKKQSSLLTFFKKG